MGMTKKNSYHLQKAQSFWDAFLNQNDSVIDATAGNGHDSLFLAKKILPHGHLFIFDIQKKALLQTQSLIEKNIPIETCVHIHYIQDSHARSEERRVGKECFRAV